MWIDGRVYKSSGSKYWAAEAEDLDVYTQGKSQKDAIHMLKEAIELLAEAGGIKLDIEVKHPVKGDMERVVAGCSDTKAFIAFLLKRQRQKSGLSIRQVVEKIGARSKTAYARYEQGRCEPSLSKLQVLLKAMNPVAKTVIHMA